MLPESGYDVLVAAPALPLLSFADAKERLLERLDLEAALEEHLDLLVLSGRLQRDQREAFKILLRTATISEPGLAAALALNRPLIPFFRTNILSPAQAFHLLEESGVRTRDYNWRTGIGNHRYVDPKTRRPRVHQTVDTQPPRLLLTSYDQEAPQEMSGIKSPHSFFLDMLTMAEGGTSFLDPQSWAEFFLLQSHRGLIALHPDEFAAVQTVEDSGLTYKKLLSSVLTEEHDGVFLIDRYLIDIKFHTFFPDVRSADGNVLMFQWDPDRQYRCVEATGWLSGPLLYYSAPRLLFE